MSDEARQSAIPATAPVVQELACLLDGLRLFGRERQIEKILNDLDLPLLHPSTLLLAGPPESCPTRFFTGFAAFLGGQQLPVVQVTCHPARREIPNGLLVALLGGFICSYRPERLEHLLSPVAEVHRWLAWYFPLLRMTADLPPLPPDNPEQVRHVLGAILQSMNREFPHVAIVHHLHEADAESLITLQEVQEIPKQGLRLLASVDPLLGDRYPAWTAFRRQAPEPILLPTLAPPALKNYLEEIAPELARVDAAELLYQVSNGQPLAVETTLRAWALDGRLLHTAEGWAIPSLEIVDAATEEPDSPVVAPPDPDLAINRILDRLGQAALVGSASQPFLRMLWRLSPEETLSLVEQGRLLGFLVPADPDDPERVDFVDLDHRDSLIGRLSEMQQVDTHRAIAQLMEEATFRQQKLDSKLTLAYHYRQAGDEKDANSYIAAAQEEIRSLLPELGSLDYLPELANFTWDISPPEEVDEHALRLITNAVLAVRLAGVQYRLYPLHGQPVIECTENAMAALDRLFAERLSLTITFDGRTFAFDGKTVQRMDVFIACRDFQQWMRSGCLQAIGFARGVQKNELARFLHVLATHEPVDGYAAFLGKIAALNLKHIKVMTWYFVLAALAKTQELDEDHQPVFTHQSILDFLARGVEALPDVEEWEDAPSATTGLLPLQIDAESPADGFLISGDAWSQLSERLTSETPSVRGVLIANLAQWVDDHADDDEALTGKVDDLLCNRLRCEDDLDVLSDTLLLVAQRVNALLAQRHWEGVHTYLEIAGYRYATDSDPQAHQLVANLLAGIGEGTVYAEWLDSEEIDTEEGAARMQSITALLGDFATRPLLTRLDRHASAQGNGRLLRLWSLAGNGAQAVLIKELRAAQQWYYLRNIILVLGEIGTREALGAISDKCGHADQFVRSAALTAAAAIAGQQATPYIAHGLDDADKHVCVVAAALAGRYPHPRLLQPLLDLLSSSHWNSAEWETAQQTACIALGHYPQPEARKALLQILQPPLLSLAKPGITLRCTAVTALANPPVDDAARAAIRRACADRNPTLREAAELAWKSIEN